MAHGKVTTDITSREKIFINPSDGTRITKLKGGENIPNSSPLHSGNTNGNKEGQGGGGSEQQESKGEESQAPTEDTQSKDIQVAKCPVCEGSGIFNTTPPESGKEIHIAQCHGCVGKGWVKL